jgi:hypothetical protein
LLAGFVDSELSDAERLRVLRWLALNPEGRELLDAQESFAPSNGEFWRSVQPPEPTPAQWSDTLNRINFSCPVAPRRHWGRWLATIGLLATAASLLIGLALPLWRHADGPPDAPSPDLVVATIDESYPMASVDDVRIISLPEAAAGLLVVGDHPLRHSAMRFARFGDVEFYGIGSDLAGRFPEMPSDPMTEEIPMIWAPRDP